MLGGGPESIKSVNDAFQILGIGSFAGMASETVDETLDNAVGDRKGFDLTKIGTSGGEGAIINIFTKGILSTVGEAIFKKIDAAEEAKLAYYDSKTFVKYLKKSLEASNPRASTKEISVLLNSTVKILKKLTVQSSENAKAIIKKGMETSVDATHEATKKTE